MVSSLPLNGTTATALERPSFPGDEHELGELLDAHRRDAYNLAYRLLGRPEDAADAVQDAFLRAVRAIRGNGAAPREPERFRSWLLRIVSNVAVDQLRLQARATTEPIDDLEQVIAASDRGQPAYELDRREQRGSILRALLSLPATQRAALTLREYRGLSYDEIGKELGLTQAATTMLLFRARAAFRQAYEGTTAQAGSVGCPELAPLLSAMLDGELDRDVWQGVDQHLKRCGRCRRELRGLRRSRRLYTAIPLLVPPAGWGYTALTGAATAEAAGLAAASAVVVPVVASAAVVPVVAPAVGMGTASGVGGVLGIVGAFIGSKAAVVAVAAVVTVAATVTTGAAAQPPPNAEQGAATSSSQRQWARPMDFAPPDLKVPEVAAVPVAAVNASVRPPADTASGSAAGPANAAAPPPAAANAAAPSKPAAPEAATAAPAEHANGSPMQADAAPEAATAAPPSTPTGRPCETDAAPEAATAAPAEHANGSPVQTDAAPEAATAAPAEHANGSPMQTDAAPEAATAAPAEHTNGSPMQTDAAPEAATAAPAEHASGEPAAAKPARQPPRDQRRAGRGSRWPAGPRARRAARLAHNSPPAPPGAGYPSPRRAPSLGAGAAARREVQRCAAEARVIQRREAPGPGAGGAQAAQQADEVGGVEAA